MGNVRASAVVFAAAYGALVVGFFLALGGVAYAQSPSAASDQYGAKVTDVRVSPVDIEVVEGASQGLPQTGLSLLGTAIVGGGLVGIGVMLRRRERRKS